MVEGLLVVSGFDLRRSILRLAARSTLCGLSENLCSLGGSSAETALPRADHDEWCPGQRVGFRLPR